MSTIYDDEEKTEKNPEPQMQTPKNENRPQRNVEVAVKPVQDEVASSNPNEQEIASYQESSTNAMKLMDDIVLKNYLTQITNMELVPMEQEKDYSHLRLFKINKMVYEKDEYATDKFISVVSAMTNSECSIYLIVDGMIDHTDFYLGIKCNDANRTTDSIAKTFTNAIKGQFPGIKGVDDDDDLSMPGKNATCSKRDILLSRFKEATAFSSYSGIPAYKNSKGEYTNANFIQGIEKFAAAMQGKRYTAIILASNMPSQEIANIRGGYENIYTELSAMATQQLAYSTNESMANAMSRTKGYADTVGSSRTVGSSDTHTDSDSISKGTSHSTSTTDGTSHENKWSKISGVLSGVSTALGTAAMATGVGAPVGLALLGLSGAAFATSLKAGQESHSKTEQKGEIENVTTGTSDAHTTNESDTTNNSHTDNFSETDGTTSTIGSSKNFTITVQNKHIQDALKRIDKQLERLEMCESTGLWSTGSYFLSYGQDKAIAEIAATVYRSIMQGEQSGVEVSAINSWYNDTASLAQYASHLSHPLFAYNRGMNDSNLLLSPTSLLSSKEVAMMIGLPRKSVPGLPIVEHVSLAKEVVRLDEYSGSSPLKLGNIFDQGEELKGMPVNLDSKSLTQHTLVTGSTGCGKSNTIYYLIDQIRNNVCGNDPKFLIIEPAKGEYKDVFGNENVYGTNPLVSKLLRVNPFRFPKGVHVLEHIDRLTEIFNVCWPMYAAMPAVLKEAMLNSYEDCGWNLYNSTNKYSEELFPTFTDLLNELVLVISNSAYSEEVKSNYTGSLVTRVKSLAIGINKEIFCGNELGDEKLFDENVIVDLSRIGSQETKSLIMGILIMRLNEYRANSGIPHNSNLRHITILEEAHNILKRCSTEQDMEGSNVAGKSVEMISNSIAEMRTYGEGFIIVDQSPSAIDISAIRNTNTKIIMRLPEEIDRRTAGKSAAMKDNQIDEIAKLPTGVAVVYQNNWEEPVLCKIAKFEKEPIPYVFQSENFEDTSDSLRTEVLKLLLKGRVSSPIDTNIDLIKKSIDASELSTFNKISIFDAMDEFEKTGELTLWKDNNFEVLSSLVSQIISAKFEVKRLADTTRSFDELTSELVKLVSNKVENIPDELILVTSQCLMRDYSLEGDVQKNIYGAWYQSVRKNKVI